MCIVCCLVLLGSWRQKLIIILFRPLALLLLSLAKHGWSTLSCGRRDETIALLSSFCQKGCRPSRPRLGGPSPLDDIYHHSEVRKRVDLILFFFLPERDHRPRSTVEEQISYNRFTLAPLYKGPRSRRTCDLIVGCDDLWKEGLQGRHALREVATSGSPCVCWVGFGLLGRFWVAGSRLGCRVGPALLMRVAQIAASLAG
jgi:hypothetical protein